MYGSSRKSSWSSDQSNDGQSEPLKSRAPSNNNNRVTREQGSRVSSPRSKEQRQPEPWQWISSHPDAVQLHKGVEDLPPVTPYVPRAHFGPQERVRRMSPSSTETDSGEGSGGGAEGGRYHKIRLPAPNGSFLGFAWDEKEGTWVTNVAPSGSGTQIEPGGTVGYGLSPSLPSQQQQRHEQQQALRGKAETRKFPGFAWGQDGMPSGQEGEVPKEEGPDAKRPVHAKHKQRDAIVNDDAGVDYSKMDPHALAALRLLQRLEAEPEGKQEPKGVVAMLQHHLTEMKDPIAGAKLWKEFTDAVDIQDKRSQRFVLRLLLDKVPAAHHSLLKKVVLFLAKTGDAVPRTGSAFGRLATLLFRPVSGKAQQAASLLLVLVEEHEYLLLHNHIKLPDTTHSTTKLPRWEPVAQPAWPIGLPTPPEASKRQRQRSSESVDRPKMSSSESLEQYIPFLSGLAYTPQATSSGFGILSGTEWNSDSKDSMATGERSGNDGDEGHVIMPTSPVSWVGSPFEDNFGVLASGLAMSGLEMR